jgi:hypothetical protein
MSMDSVVITVHIVHRAVMVTLEQGRVDRRMYDFVYDQVFSLLDGLIDAEMVRWVKSRGDHFIVMPTRGVEPIEVETEIKRRLRL